MRYLDDLMYGYNCKIRQERKKEKFRQQYYRRKIAMYGRLTNREAVEQSLFVAARHAKIVASKTHLIPDAKFRIGEFVTSLRREIKERANYGRDISTALTDKDTWSDILELSCTRSSYGPFSREEMLSIVSSVKLKLSKRSESEHIEDGLKAIDNELSNAFSLLKDIENINNEADSILTDFKELAKEM